MRPILDVMQTMPSFVYLLPFVILFGIGPACATLVTLVYALPPVARIRRTRSTTSPATTLEATASLGQTRFQRLRSVELPMAKRTIIVGVNQTMMAALSMVTIAAFVDSPGLGQPVSRAWSAATWAAPSCRYLHCDHGDHARPHHDRRQRPSRDSRRAGNAKKRQRRSFLAGGGVLTLDRGVPVEHPAQLQRVAGVVGHRDAHQRRGSTTSASG